MAKTTRSPKRGFIVLSTRFMSIVAISLTLFTLGIMGVLHFVRVSLVRDLEERVEYRIAVPDGYTKPYVNSIINKISKEPYVIRAAIISEDSIANSIKTKLGDDPVEVLGYNPFNPIICINIKDIYATNSDSVQMIQNKLSQYLPSANISYKKEVVDNLREGIGKISIFLKAFIIFQLFVTIIQIGNTTKLIIYSKRSQIRTLSLVGASKGFISKPFVVSAIIDGLIGAIISFLIIWGSIELINKISTISLLEIIGYNNLFLLSGLLIFLSVAIAGITAFVTTSKYIRMDSGKINLI